MRRWLLPLLLAVACTATAAWAKEPDALQATCGLRDVVLRSDFTSGMMDGWESFPFSEDDGYDPTLRPVDDPVMHGIIRDYAPIVDGPLQLGFIRPVHLCASPQSSLEFVYKIDNVHAKARIIVQLFAGKYVQRWSVPAQTAGWHHVRIRVGNARKGTVWTAWSIVLDALRATRATRLSFSLAHAALSGLGTPRLTLAQPDALWDDARSLYYLRRSYRQGDHVVLHFTVPAKISLYRPDGSRAPLAQDDSYRIGASDPAGIWTFQAISTHGAASGQVLVEEGRRPGLYFDALPHASPELLDQIAERRDELAAKVHPELGVNIAQMSEQWLLPGLPSYFQLLVPPSELALCDAILFRYRKDPQALAQARMLLRSMSSWPTWVHPWFAAHGQRTYYPVGLAAANLAAAREFLGDELSADDAAQLDRALLTQAILPAWDEYVMGNRLPFSVSNWIGNTVGGSLLAALTVDNRDVAGYILGLLERDREHLHAAYTHDGDYGEGTSYLRFDLEMSSLVAASVMRRLHVDLEPDLRNASRYLRNALYGKRNIVDFGDTHTELVSTDVFAYLAAVSPETETAAFYEAYHTTRPEHPLLRLLWDEAARARAPHGTFHPASSFFPERGAALMRSGEGQSQTLVAMRAGANFNHNHADQGSVQIIAGDQVLLGEAGYADYYKDPSYLNYVTQAAGHNVLLVDGNPMSQTLPGNRVVGPYPFFAQHWIGENIDAVEADLQSAYGGTLQAYRRWVIAPHHDPVIIVDHVVSSAPHRFTTLWHPAQTPLVNTQSVAPSYRIGSPDRPWVLFSFSSAPITSLVTRGPLPLADYERAETQIVERPFELRVSTQSPSTTASLITVLDPLPSTTDDAKISPHSIFARFDKDEEVVVAGEAELRLRVRNSETRPLLAFSASGTLLLLEATQWQDESRSVRSTVPVDLEWSHDGQGSVLRLRAASAGSLLLHGFGQHAQCLGNASCSVDSGVAAPLALSFLAGQNSWRLKPEQPVSAAAP